MWLLLSSSFFVLARQYFMYHFITAREHGLVRPEYFRLAETTRQTFALDLSLKKRVKRKHTHGVTCLDIDPVEGRFLISSGVDASAHLYDTWQEPNNGAHETTTFDAISTVDRTSKQSHQASISCVQWFPWDTGLFTTSSYDQTLKVWDTNTLQCVTNFAMQSRVQTHRFSPIAVSHCLVAAGCRDPAVRLCDVRSGASTHSLIGHTREVMAIAWSPISPTVLATGSADGAIRLWDIRAAGPRQCLRMYNQHNVGRGQTSHVKTSTTATAHDGTVNGLTFTPDGLFLLSTGRDNHLRLWHVIDATNTLTNFEGCTNNSSRSVYFAVSPRSDPALVFHPHNVNVISVCNQWEGTEITKLRGHYDAVNVIVYHPFNEEVYSGGDDGQVLIWAPLLNAADNDEITVAARQDRWSDSE